MRILVLAADFKPMLGGIGEYTHQVARQMQEAGDQVLVLARPAPGAAPFDTECAYTVQRVLSRPSERGSLPKRFRSLSAIVKAFAPDLILANAPQSDPVAGRLVAWRRRLPFAVVVHGQELYNYIALDGLGPAAKLKKQFVAALALARADLVVANSRFTRSLLPTLNVAEWKSVVVHPAVDPGALQAQLEQARRAGKRLPFAANRPILLTLSRLVERKGIDTVLKALPALLDDAPDLLYVIAGDGPDRARLDASVAALGLFDHVFFAGRVSEVEKALYYEASDVFVMPNRTLPGGDVEGFGIVFLEANAFGKPVVAGRSGGAPDAVVDGVTGILVDPEDPEQVRQALLSLLANPDYARRLGRQGKERVEAELNWTESARALRHHLKVAISQ